MFARFFFFNLSSARRADFTAASRGRAAQGGPLCDGGIVFLPPLPLLPGFARSDPEKLRKIIQKNKKALSFSVPVLYNILGILCLRIKKEKVYE